MISQRAAAPLWVLNQSDRLIGTKIIIWKFAIVVIMNDYKKVGSDSFLHFIISRWRHQNVTFWMWQVITCWHIFIFTTEMHISLDLLSLSLPRKKIIIDKLFILSKFVGWSWRTVRPVLANSPSDPVKRFAWSIGPSTDKCSIQDRPRMHRPYITWAVFIVFMPWWNGFMKT